MIRTFYFSPTGRTRTVVTTLAKPLSNALQEAVVPYDFTCPEKRHTYPETAAGDVVIVGVPTYAGRVPNLLLSYMQGFRAEGTRAILVCTFGNRHFDDCLLELYDLMQNAGAEIVCAGAFAAAHSFSRTLGAGRPDRADREDILAFSDRAAKALRNGDRLPRPEREIGGYFRPVDRKGAYIDFVKIKPETDAALCTDCKICVGLCPLGAIHFDDVATVDKCMKCCACIKGCPEGAKYFSHAGYLYHKEELEAMYADRKDNRLFF